MRWVLLLFLVFLVGCTSVVEETAVTFSDAEEMVVDNVSGIPETGQEGKNSDYCNNEMVR
jgi:uncharacterized protein YceK